MKWRERDGLRWLAAELPGATVAFSTRLGGASAAPFASLNLGLRTGDDRATVRRNRLALAAALGREPAGVLGGRQVHGAELVERDRPPTPNPYADANAPPSPQADGQLTRSPALTPIVWVADCLPVALSGPGGVAMIHCGWRGLAAGIVARAVAATAATAAAIGPGIGPCCYDVGPEVSGEFERLGDGVADGPMLDLPEVARRLLAEAGVGEVESAGLCTSCEPELFYSHRRDGGRTGRQAGAAWIDGDA